MKKKSKDEVVLKRYEVRVNLGDLFIQPIKGHYDTSKRKSIPQPLKHWQFRIDERGAYWTRDYYARNRRQAVIDMIKDYRLKRNPCYRNRDLKTVWHLLPRSVDAVMEINDKYDEVHFDIKMRSSMPNNRLLPPEKLEEIVKLSKGKFVKNTDFKTQGSFVISDEWRKKFGNINQKKAFLVKVPEVPYVYKHKVTEKYWAAIRVGKDKIVGGYKKWCGDHWEGAKGKRVKGSKTFYRELQSHDLAAAVRESIKLREKANA
jgi:hypothetical protein